MASAWHGTPKLKLTLKLNSRRLWWPGHKWPSCLRHEAQASGLVNLLWSPSWLSRVSCDNAFAQQASELSDYEHIDGSLIKWQRGMSSLFKTIEDTTPAGEISDSSLEFKFDADSRKYMKSAPCHFWTMHLLPCLLRNGCQLDTEPTDLKHGDSTHVTVTGIARGPGSQAQPYLEPVAAHIGAS